MIRYAFAILLALFFTSTANAQQQAPPPAEQRLGATIGALIVENNRLAIELDVARQEIAKLQAELQRAKNQPNQPESK